MDTEICVHLGGAKCAESYCTYWSTTFKKCSLGVEAEKRAELLDIMVTEAEKTLDKSSKLVVAPRTEENKIILH